jgi:hypothetical protein
MEALLIHPDSENKEIIIQFLQKMEVAYEIIGNDQKEYDPAFIAMVEENRSKYKKGEYKTITLDDVWK